jgi:hypothetical protein
VYEDRVIFFADILGFKKLVESSVAVDGDIVPPIIQKLDSILDVIRSTWNIGERKEYSTRFESHQVSHFSDSIAVSFVVNEESAVYRTLDRFHNLVCCLAAEGILVRGGIARGLLHHTEHALYGPALIAAYNLEHDKAKYPRIILDESILEAGTEYGRWAKDEREWLDRIVTKDDEDGYYFIDYFRKAGWTFSDDPVRWEYITALREHIVSGLAISDESVKSKYRWMAVKFNDLVTYCHGGIEILADCEEEAASAFAAYEAIEFIDIL